MRNGHATHPLLLLDRVIRSLVVRRVLTAVLIPVLMLGAFGGTTFFAHAHDGHGSHLHAAVSPEGARHASDRHRLAHASGIVTCDEHHSGHGRHAHPDELPTLPTDGRDPSPPLEEPGGLVISIPDHDQHVQRGFSLSEAMQAAQAVEPLFTRLWAEPEVSEEPGSPGGRPDGRFGGCPLHLSMLTAGQRLVRTSNALLI